MTFPLLQKKKAIKMASACALLLSTGASVSVRNARSTSDYTNTVDEEDIACSVSANALTGSSPNGDGSFSVTRILQLPRRH